MRRRNNQSFANLNLADLPGEPTADLIDPVVIGTFARPIGVKGEVKVVSPNQSSDRLSKLESIVVDMKAGYRRFKVDNIFDAGGSLRYKIQGFDSPESVAVLTGSEIIIPATERTEPGNNEYFIDKLVGCQAVSDDGEELGIIVEVWQQSAQDIWVIDGQFGEILVPAVKEFILDVDMEKHAITVKRLEGLWDEG
jgi:16S rRNA processing protein RimM